ncbi:MAG: NAD-dependent epimerase/dehydratase family protein [Candidatus Sericytochromatia bacterium]
MRVLVTGGAGFIGSHTVECLVAEGHEVIVDDNLTNGALHNLAGLGSRIERVIGEILDFPALQRAMSGCDAVIHLAAIVSVGQSIADPLPAHAINATGTLNVFEAARRHGIRRVVYASSAAVYGASLALPLDETEPHSPLSPYAAQKGLAEIYASLYHQLHGLSPVGLRYFNVFGPRQNPASPYSGVLSRFMAALAGGGGVTVHGDGRQSRDFVYVKDVARANYLALHAPEIAGGEVVNIGTGRSTTLLEAYDALVGLLDAPPTPPRFEGARPGDIRHSQARTERARFLLGFRANSPFATALAETFAWVRMAEREDVAGVILT